MRSAKQIVFRYNGDPTTQEIDFDMDSEKSLPEPGFFIQRRGKPWQVVRVKVEKSVTEPFEAPIYRVLSPTGCDLRPRVYLDRPNLLGTHQ